MAAFWGRNLCWSVYCSASSLIQKRDSFIYLFFKGSIKAVWSFDPSLPNRNTLMLCFTVYLSFKPPAQTSRWTPKSNLSSNHELKPEPCLRCLIQVGINSWCVPVRLRSSSENSPHLNTEVGGSSLALCCFFLAMTSMLNSIDYVCQSCAFSWLSGIVRAWRCEWCCGFESQVWRSEESWGYAFIYNKNVNTDLYSKMK